MKHTTTIVKQNKILFYGKIICIFLSLILFQNQKGFGQLMTEHFNYTDHATNGLFSQSGSVWTTFNGGDSILVTAVNLSYTGLAASSGNSVTYGGAGSENYRSFTKQTSGTVYYSLLLKINTLGTINATGGYILGFIDTNSTSLFASRLWIRLSGTSNFNIGINPGGTVANTAWLPDVLSPGTTYFIVASYTFVAGLTNDVSKIWLNTASFGGSEPAHGALATNLSPATDNLGIQRFFLRQDGTTATPASVTIDEIRVGTTWSDVTPAATITATLANITQPTGNITQGANDVVLAGFTVSSTASTDFTAVTITGAGTASSADLNTVRVYRDFNGDGSINGSDSSVSGAGVAYAASMPLTISGQTGITTANNYLIVANVDAAATPGNTVTVSVAPGGYTTTATTSTGSATGNSRPIVSAATPAITITGTLTPFFTAVGTPSVVQSYFVSGINLTDSITLAPPAEFEISLDSLTWVNSTGDTAIAQSAGVVASTKIFVRYNPSVAAAHSGNIAHTSPGAATQNQPVTGNSIATQPLSPPTLSFGTTTGISMVINFGSGDGSGRIVVVRKDLPVTYLPSDGAGSTGVNSDFGLAVDQGSGNKIVFDGGGNTVTLTNLVSSTEYHVSVFEYNGSGVTSNYLISPLVTDSNTTLTIEPTIASTLTAGCFSPTDTLTLNFSGGNGANRIVVAKQGSAVSFTPTDGSIYIGVNSNFGLASDQGSGDKILYDGSGTSLLVTGLSPLTTYYFVVYEYNGTGASSNFLASPFGSVTVTTSSNATYSVTGGTYSQDFNSLPVTGTYSFTGLGNGPRYISDCPVGASGVEGWQYGRTGGSGSNLFFAVNNGSSTSGSAYSYGTTSSTDRALGTLGTGTTFPVIGLVLVNNTPDPLTSVTISYVGEQWRNGGSGSVPNTLAFSYSLNGSGILSGTYTAEPSLNFVSPIVTNVAATLDGNLAVNQDTISSTFNLNGNWLPGQTLVLRWDDANDTGGDHGLAIDNFTFTANTTTSPLAQDSMFSFSAITTLSMTASWLNGDGAKHLVKINTSNSFTNPVNFTEDTASNVYGGSGEQVIYNGSGNSVNVTGLSAGTLYYFRAYGFNGSGASAKYITTTATENPDMQSTNPPSAASQLAIISVNGGVDPIANQPFSVVVQSQDATNNPQVVGTNTTVDLSVFAGVGNLTGATSGIILAGTNSITITGVIYDSPDFGVQLDASRSAGDTLTSGQSATFNVLGVATALAFDSVPVTGVINTVVGHITVNAIRADLTTDNNYTGLVTLSVNTGPGTISGTLIQSAVAGIATFNDIQFSAAGTYTLLASAAGLTNGISDTIIITLAPVMTELVIPQFIGCKTSLTPTATNTDRTPIAMCVQIDNLVPNTSYDIRMAVDSITASAIGYGAGNFWTGASYGGFIILNAFTTNASGSSGPYWMYMQPATSRFEPGMEHYLRIGFVINGGILPANPTLIGTKKIKALDITTAERTPSTTDDGAFLKGSSVPCISGKHILIYDNVAGTGDPLYSYLAMQSVPVNTTQSGLPVAISDVFAQTGSAAVGDYAAVIPIGANNPNGVQRIEIRNEDNSISRFATDADGVWPSGTNTTTITRRGVAVITSSDAQFNTVSITSITSTPVTCAGNIGTATVTASGVGTITYSWNSAPVQTTATAINLGAGTYTVTVTDDNGCTATSSVVVGSSSASTVTPSGPLTFCAPGSVTLTAGTAASYLWAPNGEITQSIVVTTSGTFTVTVDDGAGCIETSAPVTVNVNTFGYSGLIYSESMGNPGGTVALSTYSGWQNTAPISYTSTSTPNPTDVRISNASSGYTGVSGTGNIFFTISGPLRNFVITGINTLGYSSIALTYGLKRDGGGATDAFITEYSTDGINFTQIHSVTRAGTGWLLETATGSIPATANLQLRFSKNNAASFRLDDVKLTGTATTVEISPVGPVNLCPGKSVYLTSNIPSKYLSSTNLWSPGGDTTKSKLVTAGTYTVTAAGPNGCTATSAPVVVQDVTAPAVVVTSTDLTCNGDSSGTATSSITNGTSPFTYSWNTTPVQTTSSISTLKVGTYILNVTDSNGCQGTDTTIVSQPTVVSVTATQDSVLCFGSSTTVTVTATGGTGSYSGTGSFTVGSGQQIFIVTDSLGCTGSDTVTIANPPPFHIFGTFPNTGCFGDTIQIDGHDLSAAAYVLFNGDTAVFTILDPITIKAVVPVGATSGTISVYNSSGCNAIDLNPPFIVSCGVTLDVKMFIEGYYLGGGLMSNCLYINGTTGYLPNVYSATDADSVKISAINPATNDAVDSVTAILKTDGNAIVTFNPSVVAGKYYYIRINHRNTIETWSGDSILFSPSMSYDFSSFDTMAYGNNMIEVGTALGDPATWAIFSGDISDANLGVGFQDGVIESQDYGDMENAVYFTNLGYQVEDITGDAVVESADYGLMENNVYFTRNVVKP